MLLGLVVLFSYSGYSKWFADQGLQFTQWQYLLPKTETSIKKYVREKPKPKPDSIILKKLTAAERQQIDTLHKKIHFLDNESVNGVTPLDAFFASLEKTADSTIHIWYYGDSQIEGDRITQDLRALMQKQFGGSGQGVVPFSDVASYRFLETDCDGFNKFNVFNHRKIKGFGFNGIRYRLKQQDSSAAYSKCRFFPGMQFSKVYLLHDHDIKSIVQVSADKKSNKIFTLTGNKTLIHEGLCRELTVSYNATSTSYFGYLVEGKHGIQIDNCGIRGHSGDGLFSISNATLQQHAGILNTRLVVFHYGNNAIPYIQNDAHAAHVGNEFYKLFVKYRKALPGTSILVVSGGDMGRIIDEKPEPYPYAAALAAEMEKAAEKAGCAFFDMHALMQANDGIAGWVKQGKASIDGHLSAYGQKYFAQALYRELMKSYEIYKISHTRSHK
jgi:hypothetical protein